MTISNQLKADKKAFYVNIGKNIRRRRMSLKLSQAEAAKYIEVSRASWVNMEAGRQHINAFQLHRITQMLGSKEDALRYQKRSLEKQLEDVNSQLKGKT